MRGLLGFSFQLMVVLGILVVSLFGLGLDWRLISAIEAVFPVILLLSMIYVPESPYYLTKKGSSFLFQRLTQFRDNELVYRKKEISDISKSRWIIMKNLDFLFPGSKDLVFTKLIEQL
jgi:SP family facilitated glucose transporter-like MFS transporter 8